jgi:hypothetical protein
MLEAFGAAIYFHKFFTKTAFPLHCSIPTSFSTSVTFNLNYAVNLLLLPILTTLLQMTDMRTTEPMEKEVWIIFKVSGTTKASHIVLMKK